MQNKLPRLSAPDVRRILAALSGANGPITWDPATDRFYICGVGHCSMWELQCVKLGLCGAPSDDGNEDPSSYGG